MVPAYNATAHLLNLVKLRPLIAVGHKQRSVMFGQVASGEFERQVASEKGEWRVRMASGE